MNRPGFHLVAAAAGLSALALVGPASAVTTTTTSVTPSTVSAPPTSSMPEAADNGRVFGVFPSEPIASLKVHFRAYTDYGPENAYCTFFGPGSGTTSFENVTTFGFSALSKGELDRSQAVFNCEYYTHHTELSPEDIEAVVVEARNAAGALVPTTLCLLDHDHDTIPLPSAGECRQACGDAVCDGGEPKVSDALAVLRRALGSYTCPLRICDVNHDGDVTAADGLKVLRRAVQLRSVLLCSPKEYAPGECRFAGGDEWWETSSPTSAD